jgi:hypothetical protein
MQWFRKRKRVPSLKVRKRERVPSLKVTTRVPVPACFSSLPLALDDPANVPACFSSLPLPLLHRDIPLRPSQWGYWVPLFTIWDSVAGGEDPNAWKQFGPEPTWQ